MILKRSYKLLVLILFSFLLSCTEVPSSTGLIGVEITEDIEKPKLWIDIPNAEEPYEGTIEIYLYYKDFSGIDSSTLYINNIAMSSNGWNGINRKYIVNTSNYNNVMGVSASATDNFGNTTNIEPVIYNLRKPEIEVYDNSDLEGIDIGRIILDESQNYYWLCTSGGLIKTDFVNLWEKYDTSNSDIISNQVYDIMFIESNTIWVGTDSGICTFDGNMWSEIESPSNGDILSIVKQDNNLIWVGTSFGLYTYNGLEYEYMNFEPNHVCWETINDIKIDIDGVPYFATDDGLYKWIVNETFIETTNHNYDYLNFDFMPNLGRWYLYYSYNNYQVRISTSYGYNPTDDIEEIMDSNFNPRKLLIDSSNCVWLTTSGGLLKYKNNLWTFYDHENSDLPDCELNYISEDANGNILIGSDDGKIVLIK